MTEADIKVELLGDLLRGGISDDLLRRILRLVLQYKGKDFILSVIVPYLQANPDKIVQSLMNMLE